MTQLYDQDLGDPAAAAIAHQHLVTYQRALSRYQWVLARAGMELNFSLRDIEVAFPSVDAENCDRYSAEVAGACRTYEDARTEAWRVYRASVPSERALADDEVSHE